MICLPLIYRLLFNQREEGRKTICERRLGEKLLWAWSIRGEAPCPWPVLRLGVSHTAFSREAGKATHLCAQEEKEVGFMSMRQALPQAGHKDSHRVFTFTAREPPLGMFSPPYHASEVRGQWQGTHPFCHLDPTMVLLKDGI